MKIIIYAILLAAFLMGCSKKEERTKTTTLQTESASLPSGRVGYKVPDKWIKEEPSGQMRVAQFRLPGAEGAGDATCAVFFFPGTGGSVDANLSRWYQQYKQPDNSLTHEKAETKKMRVGDLPVTIVFVTGTYLQPKSPMMMGGPVDEMRDYALLAAVAETANGPWFFKATGPEKTLRSYRDDFEEFAKTFHIEKES